MLPEIAWMIEGYIQLGHTGRPGRIR